MIIKGGCRTNGAQLGRYLTTKGENERLKVLDVRGTSSKNAAHAVLEMSLASELTKRGRNGLYSASISPAVGEDCTMTADDWIKAADVLEAKLGLKGQSRVLVQHEKLGEDGKSRLHMHCVWQREKDGKLLKMSHNYRQHDSARKVLEQEFHHKFTRQIRDVKQAITDNWHQAKNGREFLDRAKAMGYQLAKGARRGYTLIDEKLGQKVDFVRQLIGVKTHEAEAKLKDVQGQLLSEDAYKGEHVRRLSDRDNAKTERKKAQQIALITNGQKIADERKIEAPAISTAHQKALQNFDGIIERPKTLTELIKGQGVELTEEEAFAQRMQKAFTKGRDGHSLGHEIS